jgi:hypothetical protein
MYEGIYSLLVAIMGLGILAVVVGLSFYIWLALCLQLIAKKTSTPFGWLAWIPFANLFLMVNMARENWTWALVLSIFIIGNASYASTQLGTILGPTFSIASVVTLIIIWVKICRACNRPGWWVVLLLIPIVNWVILGVLAFSKKRGKINTM